MKRPETLYARSGDLMIAYQVTGEGNAIDLVMAPGTVSHVVMAWNWPEVVDIYERLSSFVRLIRFDKRGTGMSDRPTGAATLEERSDDIRAVMDAADSQSAYVLGISEGGNMACVFAATYPERTLGLLLWGTMARWTSIEGYPWGPPIDDWRRMVDALAAHGVTDEYLLGYGAGLSKEELERERAEWLAMASPGAVAALERMNIDIDTRDILPTIHVPTLVMNRRGDPLAHVDAARDLAAHIPGARFVEFPGDFHSISEYEPEAVIAEIQEFITGTRPELAIDRVLTTVLFTDVVDSTRLAAELGDVTWKKRLAEHDRISRAEIDRHRGLLVDSTGDSLLATFDGPARAVRCALAIGSALQPRGLSVRAGVHTGEVERAGEQIRGLAVHIGARVAALAGPSEVLVSSTVKDLTVGSGIVYEDRGEHELKGVPDRWRLFAVVGPDASAT
jgi:class 3 adenylate cyclase/pimeloyl-ACP methyl ester carboxylesterase